MKHFVLAGVSATDRAELALALAKARPALGDAWVLHDGKAAADLVIADLTQFAGRVARVRAMSERTPFALLGDAASEAPPGELIVRRPLSPAALAELFNSAAGTPAPTGLRTEAVQKPIPPPTSTDAGARPDASRASFESPRGPRPCTDFAALVQRGPLLIERSGLPKLILDPAGETYHTNAPLSRLEPYFLDPLRSGECRQLPRSRLDELRTTAPGRPLVQLHWMGALLRSNGCLGAHLDPGGTYRVQRWMSVYGEYRKQYRIATLMMRPLRLHEIAQKAEASMAEVFDVVNAYDAIGLLEWQPRVSRHAAPPPETPAERPQPAATAQTTRRLLAAALLTR